MIHVLKVIRMALRSLTLHKFRSVLSVLGIIFGVMAVVAMMAIGEGAKRESLRQIELLGTNNLIVRPLQLTQSEKRSAEARQSPGLTLDDEKLLRRLPGVLRVAAVKAMPVEISPGLKDVKPSIAGVTPDYARITNIRAAQGEFIAEEHVRKQSRVCVLGADAARRLGHREGEMVLLGGDWFRVIGVLENKDYSGGKDAAITPRNSNNDIYVPITVLAPEMESEQVDELWVQADAASMVPQTAAAVDEALARAHYGVPDYEVVVPRELLVQKQRTVSVFNTMLICTAGISLLVGGIGIMNIMLANVSERTREIGICRALGACRRDIAIQFLSESLTLTVLGGLAGILLGGFAARLIAVYGGWTTVLSLESIVVAVGISALVGIFFGFYPARRAARMDPIAALKFE
ncbi:MAG TPA: ABC transporter permease [Planctomycetota bacterium]|nr:ABC transporter permease [Planctomycetota bacterium]